MKKEKQDLYSLHIAHYPEIWEEESKRYLQSIPYSAIFSVSAQS